MNGKRPPQRECKVVSVDIGMSNMAIVVAHVHIPDWVLNTIDHVELVDINVLPHKRVSRESCTLHHTRESHDKFAHFWQEYEPHFTDAAHILVERQPLSGLSSIEQLFLAADRDRVIQMHPRSMHKHFAIGHLDYNGRKEATERMARPILEQFGPSQMDYYDALERKHDIADAICQLRYFVERERGADRKRRRKSEPLKHSAVDFDAPNPFANFAYRRASTAPDDAWFWERYGIDFGKSDGDKGFSRIKKTHTFSDNPIS